MTNPTVAFFGTGGYLLFSLGAAKYLAERYVIDESTSVVTSSGGGLAAVALLTLRSSTAFDDLATTVAVRMGRLSGGCKGWFNLPKVYREVLELVVTDDALPALRDRLQVVTTTLPFFTKKIYLDPFIDRDEVVRHLLSSAYIPFCFPVLPPHTHLLEVDAGLVMKATDYTSSIVVSPRRKVGSDVHLMHEPWSLMRFLTEQEMLETYKDGYHQAVISATAIETKAKLLGLKLMREIEEDSPI